MEIVKTQIKTKCDFNGCGNFAEYKIYDKDLARSMNFCTDCIKQMHRCINSHFAPITIEPPFKKVKKLR